jgi:polyhydroxyalkanoate synthesis regulator phasin
MTENVRMILEMLAAGKISTDEADRLIAALRQSAPAAAATVERTEPQPKPRYLRVIVDSDEDGKGPTKVNLRVPLQFLRAGVRLASLMPSHVQVEVNDALQKEGIQFDISKLKPENIDELINELRDATIDISHRDDTKIRIFTE